MAAVKPIRGHGPVVIPIHTEAIANLRYIRRTMEGAAQFTAIPGWGGVAMGLTALLAAVIAHQQRSLAMWMAVWVAEALIAVALGFMFARRKARASDVDLLAQPGRKFLIGLLPAIAAGTFLTVALVQRGDDALIPGVWLLLYGAGIAAAGAFSVRVVPIMGFCFLGLGAITLFVPRSAGDFLLAAGFGVIQIIFGTIIARSYGG